MNKLIRIGGPVVIIIAAATSRLSLAGWTGQMNGTGFGRASVNVTASTGAQGLATTGNQATPSAAMAPTPGYSANATLPQGANIGTTAKVIGRPGYIWSATSTATGGDKTDNPEIEGRIIITPSRYATINVDSTIEPTDTTTGIFRINAFATGGAAMLLRGYEFNGEGTPVDLNDLKDNGKLIFETLLQGPFDLTDGDSGRCKSLVIPYSVTDTNKLFLVSDGVAVSTPNEPPVPSFTLVSRTPSGVTVQLAATDDYTISSAIKIWIVDSASTFRAGPFKAGDKIVLRRNANQDPFSRPLPSPYTAQVQTKGQALLVGEDEAGSMTNPGVSVP